MTEIREVVSRYVHWPSRLLLLALTILLLGGPSIPTQIQAIPLLASVIVFGIPHGAVDLLVVARIRHRAAGWLAAGAAYLGMAGLFLAFWFAAPVVAFVVFILLTWYHWGQGDLHDLVAYGRAGVLRTATQRGLILIVRGGLPMLIPLLAAPDVYLDVARVTIGVFEPICPDAGSWLAGVPVRSILAVAFGATIAGAFAVTWPAPVPALRRLWFTMAADTALLTAFFLIVPPLLAIGVYFSCWHSTRHIARILFLDRGLTDPVPNRHLIRMLLGFARNAALPTLGALALLAVLYLVAPGTTEGVPGFVGLYLVVLAVLTLPHTAIVTQLDVRQGVWCSPTGRPEAR